MLYGVHQAQLAFAYKLKQCRPDFHTRALISIIDQILQGIETVQKTNLPALMI
ncbi:hypothetical protein D3C75_1361560 [compost metagenome]